MYTICSELGIYMYQTGNLTINLSSYYGLVDAKIRASENYLPVQKKFVIKGDHLILIVGLWFLKIQ